MDIKTLIDTIEYNKEIFEDYNQLVTSLKKLDNVVGMKKVKSKIVKQISNYILYGDDKKLLTIPAPAVGKILCEIWIAVGKKKEKENIIEFKENKNYGTF
jgi:hypothetical protein